MAKGTYFSRKVKGGVRWYVQYTENGKRERILIDGGKREAQKYLAKVRRRIEERDPIMDEVRFVRAEIGQFFEEDLIPQLKISAARSTWRNHKSVGRCFTDWCAANNIYHVDKVTGNIAQKFINHRLQSGIKISTAYQERVTLQAAWKHAKRHGYTNGADNPWVDLEMPRNVKKPPFYYTEAQVESLLETASDKYILPFYRTILLLVSTGARVAELMSCTWDNVDLDKCVITLPTYKQKVTGKVRVVPLPEKVVEVLLNSDPDEPLVLEGKIDKLRTGFYKLCLDAGVPKKGLHSLRHTYASHLVQRGVSLYVVSKLLGHSSITTTEIYSHLSPESFESAVKLLPW